MYDEFYENYTRIDNDEKLYDNNKRKYPQI